MKLASGWAQLATPFGLLSVTATPVGVAGVHFGDAEELPDEVDSALSQEAARQLAEYVRGDRDAFDLPVDWRRVDGFRRDVLRALAEVPYGQTVSYGELADAVGKPGAARAVGAAMAANPYPVIVPCHRVLPKGRGIGGFSGARNAVGIKRWLLAREGVLLFV